MNIRRQWTDAEREFIWERCGRRCFYCGKSLPSPAGDVMHIDHVTAWSRSGRDDADNIVAACLRCNLKEGARNADRFFATLAGGYSSIFDPLPLDDMVRREYQRMMELERKQVRYEAIMAALGPAETPQFDGFKDHPPLTKQEREELDELYRRHVTRGAGGIATPGETIPPPAHRPSP